jgi:hypothetical protein
VQAHTAQPQIAIIVGANGPSSIQAAGCCTGRIRHELESRTAACGTKWSRTGPSLGIWSPVRNAKWDPKIFLKVIGLVKSRYTFTQLFQHISIHTIFINISSITAKKSRILLTLCSTKKIKEDRNQ